MRSRLIAVVAASAALVLAGCSGSSGEGDGSFESAAPTAHEACMSFFRFDYRNDDRDKEFSAVMGSNMNAAKLAYESPVASLRDTVKADQVKHGIYLLDSEAFIEVCEQHGYEAIEGSSAWFVKETAAGRPPQGEAGP